MCFKILKTKINFFNINLNVQVGINLLADTTMHMHVSHCVTPWTPALLSTHLLHALMMQTSVPCRMQCIANYNALPAFLYNILQFTSWSGAIQLMCNDRVACAIHCNALLNAKHDPVQTDQNWSELPNLVAYRMQSTIGCSDRPAAMQLCMQCAGVSHMECPWCDSPLCMGGTTAGVASTRKVLARKQIKGVTRGQVRSIFDWYSRPFRGLPLHCRGGPRFVCFYLILIIFINLN